MSKDVQGMRSEASRRGGWVASFEGGAGRRIASVGSVLGVLALMALGLAPSATADDIQSELWHLEAMGANDLWDVSTGEGIKIAVVDTGVSETPSLKGRVHPGKDVTGMSGASTDDYDGHGTTMAEFIVGSGRGAGIKGLAPGAEIVSFRTGLGGKFTKRGSRSAEAIRAAADSDARIISMSFGSDFAYPDQEEAVKYAASKGKLMFAGVGNDGEKKNFIGYPAAYPSVTGVSAADKSGKVAKYSEFGEYVDLAAPGLNLPKWCDETFRSYCDNGGGTSTATAIASASAALIWSKHPNWTSNQVLRVLIDTAGRDWPKDKPSDYLGYGLIRPARNVVKGEGKPGPADIDPITNKKTAVVGSGGGGTTPSASAPPAASPQPSKKGTSGDKAAVAAKSSDEGNSQPWLVLGILAAAAVIGGSAFAVMRARRRA
ncbi:S8 family serine peptidase [Streptomyces sp. NBC_01381]|uniref:S8 family serine peptidase n=1 Tax=Streptomyces sp. NBC_01381 TaxID=2903845 RepID=UPI00225B7C8C|nr:S8 family serine peptidase [Streptomyces sp. NBC_01381]MCX4670412.1 S8 family serine peptidase [Streptomyces sp. NBC_01381]